MTTWLLLIATLGSAWLTWDAFRLGGSIDDPANRHLPDILKRDIEHLSLAEQDELQRRSHIYVGILGPGALRWLFLLITVLLAVGTGKAFLG